jgi:hypothetical protein
MTDLVEFPFRLTEAGYVAVAEDGTDEYYASELAHLLYTKPGERVLVPEYGIEDMVFEGVDEQELRQQVLVYGPPVVIDSIESDYSNSYTEMVTVTFRGDDTEDDDDNYYEPIDEEEGELV